MAFGSNSFHQRAGDVTGGRMMAFIGTVMSESSNTRRLTLINKNPQAAQVTTMTVDTYTDAATYTFTVTVGGTVTTINYVATTADANQTGVAASIASKVNETEAVRGLLTASSAAAVLTFTGNYPGISFTIAESDSKLATPSTTTSAASADTVAFGRAMVSQGLVTDEGSQTGYVAVSSDFTAQVITITITTGAGATFTPQIRINGQTYTGDAVAHTTDAATTAAAIVTEVNALMPANVGVLAANTAGAITFTADVPGATFEADIIVAGAAFDATKAYTTGPSISTSFEKAFAGVSERSTHIENITRGGDDPAYPANHGVLTVSGGQIAVSNAQNPAFGEDVWVSLASATKGQFFTGAAASYVYLPPSIARWHRNEPSTQSHDVAVLSINTGRIA